jgi:exonuclease VII small subunit
MDLEEIIDSLEARIDALEARLDDLLDGEEIASTTVQEIDME